MSRIRKSIFDFLNPYLPEADYLDLFSGTGSYLFEAVSRRANSATGVEIEEALVTVVNSYAKDFLVGDKLKCIKSDVFAFVKNYSNDLKKFDIVMIAPPQYKQMIDKTLFLLMENNLLNDDGFILAQHDTSETNDIDWNGFEIRQQRKYGNTTFTILARPKSE